MGKYRRYSEELKREVIRLHLEEGRTKKSLNEEYNLGAGTRTHSRAVQRTTRLYQTGQNNIVKNAKQTQNLKKNMMLTKLIKRC